MYINYSFFIFAALRGISSHAAVGAPSPMASSTTRTSGKLSSLALLISHIGIPKKKLWSSAARPKAANETRGGVACCLFVLRDMTDEEAVELGRRAIYHAAHRDGGSGGVCRGEDKSSRVVYLNAALSGGVLTLSFSLYCSSLSRVSSQFTTATAAAGSASSRQTMSVSCITLMQRRKVRLGSLTRGQCSCLAAIVCSCASGGSCSGNTGHVPTYYRARLKACYSCFQVWTEAFCEHRVCQKSSETAQSALKGAPVRLTCLCVSASALAPLWCCLLSVIFGIHTTKLMV